MSRILFAWELGGGYGHLGPFLPVSRLLMAPGHGVTIVARDVERANVVFGSTGARVLQGAAVHQDLQRSRRATVELRGNPDALRLPDAPPLAGMVRAWLDVLTVTRTDVLIADHAPVGRRSAGTSGQQ